jgi:hypothetical protein
VIDRTVDDDVRRTDGNVNGAARQTTGDRISRTRYADAERAEDVA